MNMQMSFSVAETVGSKSKNRIFYVIFFNTDISTQDIATKMTILHVYCEGSLCEIFNQGPSSYVMLSRKLCFENI